MLYFFIHGFITLWILLANGGRPLFIYFIPSLFFLFFLTRWSHLLVNGLKLFSAWLLFHNREEVAFCCQNPAAGLSWWTNGNSVFVILAERNVCCLFQRGAYASRRTRSHAGNAFRSPRRADGAQTKWVEPGKPPQSYFITWLRIFKLWAWHCPSFVCNSCYLSHDMVQSLINLKCHPWQF